MYTIFGKDNCQYCTKAKIAIQQNNKPYKVFAVGIDLTVNEFKEQYPNAKSLPVVLYDDRYIGGYSQLLDHLNPPLSKE